MKNLQKVSIVDLDEASQWGVSEWEGGKKIVFINFFLRLFFLVDSLSSICKNFKNK
tara:strand:+ start:83 stop:250 length:168 start_codon:yes stop_codon:yes gene_type:complete